jgi:mRNA-degrading endonuclease RelE of RelBE toxin-antitoxin system
MSQIKLRRCNLRMKPPHAYTWYVRKGKFRKIAFAQLISEYGITGRLSGYWSYRVGDYRVIAEIHNHQLQLVLIEIDHRGTVYR